MKKLLSLLLVCVMMLTLATSVSAAKNGGLQGIVPKIEDGKITIDGNMDDVYAYGLGTTIERLDGKYFQDTGTRGQVWMLWSETTFYVYAKVLDNDVVPATPDLQQQSSWITDSFEIFFDLGNEQTLPIYQYRVDYSGFNTHYVEDESVNVRGTNEDVAPYFKSAAKWTNDGYSVELAIDLTRFEDIEEGYEIGIQLLVNDMTSEKASERTAIFYMPSKLNAGDWHKVSYDFIYLGGMYDPNAPITEPVITEEVTTEEVTTEEVTTEEVTTEEITTEPEETEEETTEEQTEEEAETTTDADETPEEESAFPVVPVVIAVVVVLAVIVGIIIAKKKKN